MTIDWIVSSPGVNREVDTVAQWLQILAHRPDCAGNTSILHLFGSPFVTINDSRMVVPESSRRLVAFVALHRGRVERRYAAGALWPGGDDLRAAGNLRSALWRLKRGCLPLIDADKCSLSLRDDVVTDAQLVSDWADRLIDGSPTQADLDVRLLGLGALELLPGWYDDWALMERELFRQRLLHALEALSAALVRADRCSEAVDAAMLAASMEPLRESAQRALIEAHLAEGNLTEARRGYDMYRRVVLRELGVEPHPLLLDLVDGAAGRNRTPHRQAIRSASG